MAEEMDFGAVAPDAHMVELFDDRRFSSLSPVVMVASSRRG